MKLTKKPMQKTLIIALLFLISAFTPALSNHREFKADEWIAHWIWTHSDKPANTWVVFRKKVTLDEKPTTAVTRIAAENKYWLYVNGKLAVRDGGLDIRPDLENTYYDEIDLAPFLKKGDNVIAALAWHKGGEDSYSQRTVDQGGFLFQAHITGANATAIVSDGSWKAVVHPAFGHTEQLKNPSDASYKWVAWPVSYDARKELIGWETLNYNDDRWPSAETRGVPPTGPWNKLFHRTIPFWKDHGLQSYLNEQEFPRTIANDQIVEGKLAGNIQGTPYLTVKAAAGVKIKIVLNNYYYQEYVTRDGEQEFECYAWQNSSGHSVKYEFSNVTGPVEALDLKFRETSYNTEIIGKFSSNDEALNTLWDKCKNTSLVCMRDIYFDCPDRERGQWWGDVSEQILYSFCLYDTMSNLLSRKAYRELMYSQKPDGSLYTTAPGTVFHLPDQNITAVAMLWDYYLYSGDQSLLEELYPMIKKYVEYCNSTANDDGMLILQEGPWNWIDWGENKDVATGSANAVVNAAYVRLLDAVMHIAGLLEKDSDKAWYAGLQSKVKANFNAYFWNSDAKAYVFHRKDGRQSAVIDDRSNAWAILAGLADSVQQAGAMEVLKTRYDASPYQEMYVEMAMMQLDAKAALDRMRARHKEMIDSWSSTLWEEFPAWNSNNHAWSTGPLYHLSAGVLGIKPVKVKYSEFHFLPRMGDLTNVSGVLPTPYGPIEASCRRDGETFTQAISFPPNTVGLVGIPKLTTSAGLSVKTVKAGKQTIWKNDKARKAMGLEFIQDDGEFLIFKVQPGSWTFTADFR